MLRTQTFEKRGTFPVKKILRPIFSRSIEHDKRKGTIH